jgi:hypothetical protein
LVSSSLLLIWSVSKAQFIDRLTQELSLSNFLGADVHIVDFAHILNISRIALQNVFGDEDEAVRVESIENRALHNYLGHEKAKLKPLIFRGF